MFVEEIELRHGKRRVADMLILDFTGILNENSGEDKKLVIFGTKILLKVTYIY